MVYRDGKSGRLYAKKFKIGGVTRDKEYPLFKTHSRSRIFFFAIHDSEKKNSRVLVHLDPELKRIKERVIEFDFAWLDIQGRSVKGSTLTSHKVDRVVNAPKGEEESSANRVNRLSMPKEEQREKESKRTPNGTPSVRNNDEQYSSGSISNTEGDQTTFDFPKK